MNKSRIYLLSLSVSERKKLAFKIRPDKKSFHLYLYQIGAKHRTPSREMAALLQKATSGKVQSKDFEREALKKVSA